MATDDNSRPIGNTPITDASAATAPVEPTSYGSNADLRVAEDDHLRDAAITATGEDIDNDHADERPIDRSDDSEAERIQQQYAEDDYPEQQRNQEQQDEQFTPTE